jgi:hypothetical protein
MSYFVIELFGKSGAAGRKTGMIWPWAKMASFAKGVGYLWVGFPVDRLARM